MRLVRPPVALPRLLVIDDESGQSSVRQLLGSVCKVVGVRSGYAALQTARRHAPDAVVLELRAPAGPGLELLSALRAAIPDVPVIVVSEVGALQPAVDAMRRGAADYLSKPLTGGELQASIDRALARRPRVPSATPSNAATGRTVSIVVVSPDRCRRAVLAALLRRYGSLTAVADGGAASLTETRGGRRVPVLDELPSTGGNGAASAGGLTVLFERARTAVIGRVPDLPSVSPSVTRAVDFIAAHCTTAAPIGVRVLAEAAGLSESRFAHRFRHEIGMSPCQFVRRVRVEIARELLGSGGRRSDVARTLGFVDGSHLATVFRAETGQRLAEYRRACSLKGG